ncbi:MULTISPECIES: penicillin acylase family protein [Actinomycetes]|uniref:penicillin acylase family protein n=1 Tax=Actinomycetes TaxID=1760 RepID=UPI001F3EA240|nr:penicillin acylase family protein [Amycolatopsis sp. AA4]
MRRAAVLVLAAAVAVPAGAGAVPAAAETDTTDHNDYCGGQCHDILPGGQAGGVPRSELPSYALSLIAGNGGIETAHSNDQGPNYDRLRTAYPGLTNENLGKFLNSASFGIPAGAPWKPVVPAGRTDVTISRDNLGIPHVKGTTREGATFGSGYAAAEDRLFMMDLLRNVAKGSAVGFAGSAAESFQNDLWPKIAETENDRQAQLDRLASRGPDGKQVVSDLHSYVAGVNAYIDSVQDVPVTDLLRTRVPVEYTATGSVWQAIRPTITPFTTSDVVALVTLLGGQFGAAGGSQAVAAAAKVAAEQKYGKELGDRLWASLRTEEDPETTVTQHGPAKVPYGVSPQDPREVAMPDAGSLTYEPIRDGAGGTGSAAAGSVVSPGKPVGPSKGMSNALVVSGAHSKSGHPVAVFGPQTGYFAPEILMLQDIEGPGIRARGVMFPGTGPYVQIGRGPDYSWSATSAHQSIVDTYAVRLCNADGSAARRDSMGYLDGAECRAMDPVVSPDGLRVLRTKYGLVRQRATVGGVPVAYAELRSTYLNELDSAVGFLRLNDPARVRGPEDFKAAVSDIGMTFNWFYVDADHTAFFNSGLQPVRAGNVDPNLPVWAKPETEWRNWDARTNVVAGMPAEQHPGSTDQDYYVSWNNKSAAGQVGGFGDGGVHRGDLLDGRVRNLIANGNKIDRADLVKAMEEAAVTDLRGEKVLPNLLQVIYARQAKVEPEVWRAVNALQQWLDRGAKRTTMPGAGVYIDGDAIKVMDAWWPLLVKAVFQPGMGDDLYNAVVQNLPVDEAPSTPLPGTKVAPHRGSAFEYGWWSYVDKDLRSTLGQPVNGPLPTQFCGNLGDCWQTLYSTLKEAIAKPAAEVYPKDQYCSTAGDAVCADSIQFLQMGVLKVPGIGWQNRPTYQQVVEFPKHR